MYIQSSDYDERGISPVIGVILMIAITVLLAATTAVFVLGFGDQTSATPTASFSFDYEASSDSLDVTHTAGDTLNTNNVYVVVSSASVSGDPDDPNGRYAFHKLSDLGADKEISASNKAVVSADTLPDISSSATLDLSGATVRVVWEDPEADNSAELAEWTN